MWPIYPVSQRFLFWSAPRSRPSYLRRLPNLTAAVELPAINTHRIVLYRFTAVLAIRRIAVCFIIANRCAVVVNNRHLFLFCYPYTRASLLINSSCTAINYTTRVPAACADITDYCFLSVTSFCRTTPNRDHPRVHVFVRSFLSTYCKPADRGVSTTTFFLLKTCRHPSDVCCVTPSRDHPLTHVTTWSSPVWLSLCDPEPWSSTRPRAFRPSVTMDAHVWPFCDIFSPSIHNYSCPRHPVSTTKRYYAVSSILSSCSASVPGIRIAYPLNARNCITDGVQGQQHHHRIVIC